MYLFLAMLLFEHVYVFDRLFSAKNPVPIRCPVAGKFNFTQRGEHPFKTRYDTMLPLMSYYRMLFLKFLYGWKPNLHNLCNKSILLFKFGIIEF